MATLSLATPPPPSHLGQAGGLDQARKLHQRLSGTRLERAVEALFVPMIIDEDSFRPEEFVAHEDPLDYQAALKQFFPGHDTITAQVTPFTPTSDLERRVLRARQQGIERMVFVGVPREYREADVVGLYPDQALSHFTSMLPRRGVITIPARAHERDRLAAKARAGANFTITQLLFGHAVLDIARGLADTFDNPPELILSFGYVPALEADQGLIQWLIQDPNAGTEIAWVEETAGLDRDQRKQRLTELYGDVVERVRGFGIEPGINFEAPYGLSASAVATFEAMLAIYDPREARA
jgi:hypothetical protein